MSNKSPCNHEVLASNGIARVCMCRECSCVSLDIGAVTVRLDENSLETLWFVLAEANAALQRRRLVGAVHESRLPQA